MHCTPCRPIIIVHKTFHANLNWRQSIHLPPPLFRNRRNVIHPAASIRLVRLNAVNCDVKLSIVVQRCMRWCMAICLRISISDIFIRTSTFLCFCLWTEWNIAIMSRHKGTIQTKQILINSGEKKEKKRLPSTMICCFVMFRKPFLFTSAQWWVEVADWTFHFSQMSPINSVCHLDGSRTFAWTMWGGAERLWKLLATLMVRVRGMFQLLVSWFVVYVRCLHVMFMEMGLCVSCSLFVWNWGWGYFVVIGCIQNDPRKTVKTSCCKIAKDRLQKHTFVNWFNISPGAESPRVAILQSGAARRCLHSCGWEFTLFLRSSTTSCIPKTPHKTW